MDVNDFILGSVGGKAFKFANLEDEVFGTIISPPELRQQTEYGTSDLKFDKKTGKPEMEVVIKLQTGLRNPEDANDDGIRVIYARGTLLRAIGMAMTESGARELLTGGKLWVKYSGTMAARNPMHKDAKLYKAKYAPPVSQVSQILAQEASQPETAVHSGFDSGPRTTGVVFENQHRAQDVPARPMSTLEQMRNASQNPVSTSEAPF